MKYEDVAAPPAANGHAPEARKLGSFGRTIDGRTYVLEQWRDPFGAIAWVAKHGRDYLGLGGAFSSPEFGDAEFFDAAEEAVAAIPAAAAATFPAFVGSPVPAPAPKEETLTTADERRLIKCEVCGVPWAIHTAACTRHGHMPFAFSGAPVPTEPALKPPACWEKLTEATWWCAAGWLTRDPVSGGWWLRPRGSNDRLGPLPHVRPRTRDEEERPPVDAAALAAPCAGAARPARGESS